MQNFLKCPCPFFRVLLFIFILLHTSLTVRQTGFCQYKKGAKRKCPQDTGACVVVPRQGYYFTVIYANRLGKGDTFQSEANTK